MICVLVFKLKLKKMMDVVKKGAFVGVIAWLYSIEFQKQGLPHAHLRLWLMPEDSITRDKFDATLSAEIPDKNIDPELYDTVVPNMVNVAIVTPVHHVW